MISDYEDDTHFCLKCHTTIIGLDNYVRHRKSGCSKTEPPKSPLPSQLLLPADDETFNLKADDFFSSLELQSSTKKPSNQPQTTSSGKNVGILTRSKTTAAIQAQAQTPTTNTKDEIPQSKSGKNVWIGGHQLKLGCGDNQSKLIKAVDNLERRSKEEPTRIEVYEDSEYESEEYDYDDTTSDEDNHDAPPKNHTGGKWKPSSPISWNRHDWNAPPIGYTGGKWKPTANTTTKSLQPPPSHTKGKWKPITFPDDSVPPASFTGSKWTQSKTTNDVPPPTHTKGKWKPNEFETSPEQTRNNNEDKKTKIKTCDEDELNPYSSSNKWLQNIDHKKVNKITDDSPFRKSNGTVQYWCRPCNRRLSSKIVYERHLKSELHFKRTSNDNEFDDISLIKDKRLKKNKTSVLMVKHQKVSVRENVKKRIRKTIFVNCEGCKSKVNKSLMGKHLISHYHCRTADFSSIENQRMILDNIWSVVKQYPFQCGVCKFYSNHQKDFLKHWLSDYHNENQNKMNGIFTCSYCKFQNENNDLMYEHLISNEHNEVVAVINRSVPIIIKKIQLFGCLDCNQTFLLRIQLKKHCESENHKIQRETNDWFCTKCDQLFVSNISLSRHQQIVHKDNVFICTICSETFQTALEAKLHRRTVEHRHKVGKKTSEISKRQCEFCKETFTNFLEFKQHRKLNHKEHSPKCPKCGEIFSIPQELSVHLRTKSCELKDNQAMKLKYSCTKCEFSSDSHAELLFHEILHTDPMIIHPSDDSKDKKPKICYSCSICKKIFPKLSLRCHLRKHTKEKPFACTICGKAFIRKNNWLFHMKNHENKKSLNEPVKIKNTVEGNQIRKFLCSTCGASFVKKSVLKQHLTRHSGKLFKCSEVDCFFAARNMSELRAHLQIHTDIKNYACNQCDYKGKTKQQLLRHSTIHNDKKKYKCTKCAYTSRIASHFKRHLRLHTGSKPFSCPHCSYKCNNLENLRKHVLSTKKHSGKCIYECKFCTHEQFQSNFAKEFRGHLVTQHSEMFENGSQAAIYITGIYKAQDDIIVDAQQLNEDDDDNNETSHLNSSDDVSPHDATTETDTVYTDLNNMASCSNLIINTPGQDPGYSTYIISKDFQTVTNQQSLESWNLVPGYDVVQSATLIPFSTYNGPLFQ